MDLLDEKGFVIIDDLNRPYWYCMYFGVAKIMYWNNGQQCWTILRDANQVDIWQAAPHQIPDKEAEYYHNLHRKFNGEN